MHYRVRFQTLALQLKMILSRYLPQLQQLTQLQVHQLAQTWLVAMLRMQVLRRV